MKPQIHMYYDGVRSIAESDMLFLDMVKDGMTKEELQRNIERRPQLWARYSNWLDKLPSKET